MASYMPDNLPTGSAAEGPDDQGVDWVEILFHCNTSLSELVLASHDLPLQKDKVKAGFADALPLCDNNDNLMKTSAF